MMRVPPSLAMFLVALTTIVFVETLQIHLFLIITWGGGWSKVLVAWCLAAAVIAILVHMNRLPLMAGLLVCAPLWLIPLIRLPYYMLAMGYSGVSSYPLRGAAVTMSFLAVVFLLHRSWGIGMRQLLKVSAISLIGVLPVAVALFLDVLDRSGSGHVA
jgi:hypothetical protein